MKRIIFSIYGNNIKNKHETGIGPTDYKKLQFEKFKHKIEASHKKYAKTCSADYNLFATTSTNYVDIQFEKIIKFEELCYEYDEILYIDFDVIPLTDISFFEKQNLTEYICCHSIEKKLESSENRRPNISIKDILETGGYCDPMNMYNKNCAKRAMLLLDDIVGSNFIVNTGVVGASKKLIEKLDFSNRLTECDNVLKEAIIDNIYPSILSSSWKRNNEIYFSYLLERHKIPSYEIGYKWNFIIEDESSSSTEAEYDKKITPAAYFVHQVNKNFEAAFMGNN